MADKRMGSASAKRRRAGQARVASKKYRERARRGRVARPTGRAGQYKRAAAAASLRSMMVRRRSTAPRGGAENSHPKDSAPHAPKHHGEPRTTKGGKRGAQLPREPSTRGGVSVLYHTLTLPPRLSAIRCRSSRRR